ncbi:uncharacterized protein [Nicotiana tomentosiformis]|uniref:uncharacterized protein n=1 Tax=Nicotiana tomentosiformis TaxID=4098 RepID=UPI00388C84C6
MTNIAASDHVWIVDSGATHHVTHCKSVLDYLKRTDHKTDGVQLPTGNKGLYNGKVMGIGRENNGLYLIKENLPIIAASFLKENGETRLWHLCNISKQGKSPYELLYGKPVKVDHLRVFGCLYYTSNLPKGDKFTVKARNVVLIGYSETQKGYRLYDLENGSIFISKDVLFKEEIFIFDSTTDSNGLKDFFTSQYSFAAGDVQQPHATVIPTTPQDMQLPFDDNTATEVENTSDATVIDHVVYGGEHENAALINKNSIFEQAAETTEVREPLLEITEEAGAMEMHPQLASAEVETRKSCRQGKLSIWLKDYITTVKTHANNLYSISNAISYDNLYPTYQSYLSVFSVLTEPQSFKEAAHDPSNMSLVEEAKSTLRTKFKFKDLGELRYFLGIEVMRSDKGLLLNQRKYALELISTTGLAAAKPASTPIELNQKLTTT